MVGLHRPVLLNAVIAALKPHTHAIYIDGTFGGGGYSRALLGSTNCEVWGIDRDPQACIRGKALTQEFEGRFKIIHGNFGYMDQLLAAHQISRVDGIMLDLGVSSFQIDDSNRGFSFRHDGPLDMRMSIDGPTAADIVNETPQNQLADIIFNYGEERRSRRIASAIVSARSKAPIMRTQDLAKIVRECFSPVISGSKTIDPATRTFQALRIFINDELGALERGLNAAESLLCEGGRLAVVSFHSLEDRIVKTFLRNRSTITSKGSRHSPENETVKPPSTFIELNRRPIRPEQSETITNPRARSARLRTAERTNAKPQIMERHSHGDIK